MGAEPVPANTLSLSGQEASRLRGVHQELVDAALVGDGLEQLAERAAVHVRRPVAIVVPGRAASVLGVPPGTGAAVEVVETLERFEVQRAGADPAGERKRTDSAGLPADVEALVDITSGGELVGGAYMLKGRRSPPPDAAEVLHLAGLTTLTILALEEASEREAVRLGSGLVEELRRRELDRDEIVRRAARLGSDLGRGAVVIACETGGRRPHQAAALVTSSCPDSISAEVDGRILAVLPALEEGLEATMDAAFELADRLRGYGRTGVSSFYVDVSELRRAIQEAELVLEVASTDERIAKQLNGRAESGIYRLLFRALASHPEEVRTFYEDTVATLVRYDRQYRTDLLATLESYLEQDCNMNATARAIFAHRHTVAYRLQRVKELTRLDPMVSEDRERLSLGLKAYRIVAPRLPR